MQMLTFTDFRCAQRFAVLCNSFVCISPLLWLCISADLRRYLQKAQATRPSFMLVPGSFFSFKLFVIYRFYVSAPYCSLYKLYINHNQTLKTLTFRSLSETFVRSCSILFLVLATTVVMWHGKKSVILSLQRRYSALFAGQIWRSLAWHCPVIGFHHATTSHVCITDEPYFFITHNWFSRVRHMASIERPDVCLYICVCTAYMCK